MYSKSPRKRWNVYRIRYLYAKSRTGRNLFFRHKNVNLLLICWEFDVGFQAVTWVPRVTAAATSRAGSPNSWTHNFARQTLTLRSETVSKRSNIGREDVWVPAPSAPPPLSHLLPHLHLLLHLLPCLLPLLPPLLPLLLGPRGAPHPHRDHPEEPDHGLLGGYQPTCQCSNSPRSRGRQVGTLSTLLYIKCNTVNQLTRTTKSKKRPGKPSFWFSIMQHLQGRIGLIPCRWIKRHSSLLSVESTPPRQLHRIDSTIIMCALNK